MAADRVPQPGEVWSFRHRWPFGRVTIEVDPSTTADRVVFRYHGSRTEGECESVEAFVRAYHFLAVDEATAVADYGPQVRHRERSLADMPIRLGTAVD